MRKHAHLSDCKMYRYMLARQWGGEGLLYAFFGINPSTADAEVDDQTVKKWIGFAERNGGKGFIVGNVFAYRATDVNKLALCPYPVGIENPISLERIIPWSGSGNSSP